MSNYAQGWEFVLLLHKYPIIIYINLHNINNYKLHQLKNYMTIKGGYAQVLNTHQLEHCFQGNIKFKFLLTGNLIALTFQHWPDVWDFIEQQKKLSLIILTMSIQGTFLNLYEDVDTAPLDVLQHIFQKNNNLMIQTTAQIGCYNNYLNDCLYQPIDTTVNNIWRVLMGLVLNIENFSNSIKY